MAKEGNFKVLLTEEAFIAFEDLDGSVKEKIRKKLKALEQMRPTRTLRKHPDIWVLEIGDFRALYTNDKISQTRTIFFIGDHKEYERRYFRMFKE